jgi:hypothetical protein
MMPSGGIAARNVVHGIGSTPKRRSPTSTTARTRRLGASTPAAALSRLAIRFIGLLEPDGVDQGTGLPPG